MSGVKETFNRLRKNFLNLTSKRRFGVFYKLRTVEYFRFDKWNEYLILYYELRLSFIERVKHEVISSIGNTNPQRIRDRIRELREKGIKVDTDKEFTWEEFHTFAFIHPVLKNDSWIKMRKTAIEANIARR